MRGILKKDSSTQYNYGILCITIFCIFSFSSCNSKKEVKDNTETEASNIIEIDTVPEEIHVFPDDCTPVETSLILLPRDEYATYSDHYNYIPEGQYFNENPDPVSHLEDTISTGFVDNNYAQGLVDSLRLGMDWLCIRFSHPDRGYSFVINKAKTVSYSYNEIIDFVPMTLLSVQDTDEYLTYDIAFRGDYEKTDFSLTNKKKLLPDEQKQAIHSIQKKVQQKDAIPPRPMTTDTLLLNDIYKPTDNIVIARYQTTSFSDSDADFGNECIFVLQNNHIVRWFAGMGCRSEVFELRGEKYLYIDLYTYATSKTTLLRLGENEIEEVYSYLVFGD